MKIKSSAFKDGHDMPEIYTCDGMNINPPLEFEDVPGDTVTLALTMEDPDAPTETFDHWLVWNINSSVRKIEEDNPPLEAVYGNNSFGYKAYGGPCPPSGVHRYFFRLYALSKRLSLNASETSKAELLAEIEEHLIEKAELIGKYSRR